MTITYSKVSIAKCTRLQLSEEEKEKLPQELKTKYVGGTSIKHLKQMHEILKEKGHKVKGTYAYIRYDFPSRQAVQTWIEFKNITRKGLFFSKYTLDTLIEPQQGLWIPDTTDIVKVEMKAYSSADVFLTEREFQVLTKDKVVISFPEPDFRR